MIERVISGGQTGADQAGWRAARQCGIPTGGWMPKGFRAEDGYHPEFAALYGAKECVRDDYPSRTRLNIENATALLWFGTPYSPGGKLTLRACQEAMIPHFILIRPGETRPRDVAGWIKEQAIGEAHFVLNVAGNRESSSPDIGAWVEGYLIDVFRRLQGTAGANPNRDCK